MNSTSKTRLQKNETNQMKTVKQKIKAYNAQCQDQDKSLKKKCEGKVKHGQHIWSVKRQLISEDDTFLWLSRGCHRGRMCIHPWWHNQRRHKDKSLKTKMTFYDTFVCNQIINITIYLHTICTILSNYFYKILTSVS